MAPHFSRHVEYRFDGGPNILGGNAQRLFNLDPVFSPEKIARRNRAAGAGGPGQGNGA